MDIIEYINWLDMMDYTEPKRDGFLVYTYPHEMDLPSINNSSKYKVMAKSIKETLNVTKLFNAYKNRFGTYKGFSRWKLIIDYLSMSNESFFKVYGFNFVPKRHEIDFAWEVRSQFVEKQYIYHSIQDERTKNISVSINQNIYNNLQNQLTPDFFKAMRDRSIMRVR